MKEFLLPLQNMIRADLFSGSLAVWSVRGGAAPFARQFCPSRAKRGEGMQFELFLKYIARKEIANASCPPRFARRLICMGFFGEKEMLLSIRAKEISSFNS